MDFVITPHNKVAVLKDGGTWQYYQPENDATSLQRWQSVEVPPNVLEFFIRLFERVGVHVIDTGEEFTCILKRDGVAFEDTLDEDQVDYTVEIYSYQVDRLAKYVSSGKIDDVEKFRVLKAVLKSRMSGAKNPLKNPLMASVIFRWLIKGKKVLHVNVVSPDPQAESDGHYTFLYADEWVVTEGLHGTPKRVFTVALGDALELQRKLYEGMKVDSWIHWLKIASWYKKWRDRVSRPVSAA